MQRRHVLFFLILFFFTETVAQVTIGIDKKPVGGAILDLRNLDVSEGAEVTATKGLGLPRIDLTSKTNLFPMFKNKNGAIDPAYLGANKQIEDERHTGLLVYHTGSDVCAQMNPGLYVWGGDNWDPLTPDTDHYEWIDNGNDTGVVTDFEGNSYAAKKFGNTWWTTENMISLKDANGEWIFCSLVPGGINGLYINPGFLNYGVGGIKVSTEIPQGVIKDYTNGGVPMRGQSIKDFVKEFGLLYGHDHAMKACPKGWSVPSVSDWSELITAVDKTTASPTPAKNIAGAYMRKNKGKEYIEVNERPAVWGSRDAAIAESDMSGFNAVPSGYVLQSGTDARAFSIYTYWWTDVKGQTMRMTYEFANLAAAAMIPEIRLSVRCVKK